MNALMPAEVKRDAGTDAPARAEQAAAFSDGNAVPHFYDVDGDEVWAIVSESRRYYLTAFAPDEDRLIAWASGAANSETVIVDMASGAVTQILSFASELTAPWTGPEKIQLRVRALGSTPQLGAARKRLGTDPDREACEPHPCEGVWPRLTRIRVPVG